MQVEVGGLVRWIRTVSHEFPNDPPIYGGNWYISPVPTFSAQRSASEILQKTVKNSQKEKKLALDHVVLQCQNNQHEVTRPLRRSVCACTGTQLSALNLRKICLNRHPGNIWIIGRLRDCSVEGGRKLGIVSMSMSKRTILTLN